MFSYWFGAKATQGAMIIIVMKHHERDEIPFTGWPTDRVFKELIKRMDARKGVFVIVLDEIDHLVRKAGDDLLYNLTNLNSFLKDSRACVIGISNDLKFTEFLADKLMKSGES